MPREAESEHGSLLRSLCIADAARRRKRARLASTVALHRGCRARKKASTARFYGRFASRMPREEESEHGSLLRSLCIADAARGRKRARLASTVALHRGCRARKKASTARFYGRFASRMPREEESEHGSLLRSLCIADAARGRKRARLASTVALHRGCRAKKKASTARFYGRFASRMPRGEESEQGLHGPCSLTGYVASDFGQVLGGTRNVIEVFLKFRDGAVATETAADYLIHVDQDTWRPGSVEATRGRFGLRKWRAEKKASTARLYGALACGSGARRRRRARLASTVLLLAEVARGEEGEHGSLLRCSCLRKWRAEKKASTARFYGALACGSGARRRKRARLASTVLLLAEVARGEEGEHGSPLLLLLAEVALGEEGEHGSLLRSPDAVDRAADGIWYDGLASRLLTWPWRSPPCRRYPAARPVRFR